MNDFYANKSVAEVESSCCVMLFTIVLALSPPPSLLHRHQHIMKYNFSHFNSLQALQICSQYTVAPESEECCCNCALRLWLLAFFNNTSMEIANYIYAKVEFKSIVETRIIANAIRVVVFVCVLRSRSDAVLPKFIQCGRVKNGIRLGSNIELSI